MHDLARKLMNPMEGLPAEEDGQGASEIVAQTLEREKPRYRVGLWPLLSTDAPEVAMGVMAVLGYLLERWQDVSVYYLPMQVDSETVGAYQWSIEDSQFGVDDWQLEGLDENVALWGGLERQNATGWTLTLELENDLADDPGTVGVFTYTAQNTSELIGLLQDAAKQIAAQLDTHILKRVAPDYMLKSRDNVLIEGLLKKVFTWERALFLNLWGLPWTQSQAAADHEALLKAGEMLNDDFAGWCVAHATARGMFPIFGIVGDLLAAKVNDVVTRSAKSAALPALLGEGLYRLGREQEACELLEDALDAYPRDPVTRVALAEQYRRAGRVVELIQTLQEAIQSKVTNITLYMFYADLLLALRQRGLSVPAYVLSKDTDNEADRVMVEAIAAYQAVLDARPDDVDALTRQIGLMAELDDGRLWEAFAELVQRDKRGEYIRSVVDGFLTLEDVSPACEILERAVDDSPGRADLRVSLAAVYLIDEQWDAARAQLEQAESLTDDPATRADIERLLLSADDPDFEARIGDITDALNAGQQLSLADIDYLEDTLENAPSFAQGYLLLAKGYLGREETTAALETLLDGQKELPGDPDIAEQLARLLWSARERDLAFDYLNKGLAQNPDYVPLLAVTGQFLFEDGRTDEAKIFLARAEAIAPMNPTLVEVKRRVAGMMSD